MKDLQEMIMFHV